MDAAGSEIINGGQDLYSFRPTSPCSGLPTYQTYLLLNHPIAAFAQSDCHARALFGRVWTGMWLPDAQPTTWEAIHRAIAERRTFAAMGDIRLNVWCEANASQPPVLRWQGAEGAEIYVYCADQPVAYLDPIEARAGAYQPASNGYYWLLARRDLAVAVSSPLLVNPLPGDRTQVAARRTALLADPLVQYQADKLKQRLDQLRMYTADWGASPFPVQRYLDWLSGLLPERWALEEYAAEPNELRRLALQRLHHAQPIAGAVLEDVLRQHYRAELGEQAGIQVLLAPQPPTQYAGALQFHIEAPRAWAGVVFTDQAGHYLASLAMPVDGERDPINGQRTRYQMQEIITWLQSGEMHEYVLSSAAITCQDSSVSVQFDLYPARLAWHAATYPDLAAQLEVLLLDPQKTEFHVAIRMPRRYGVLLQPDALPNASVLIAHNSFDDELTNTVRPPNFFADTLSAADFLGDGLVVQIN